MRKDKFYNIFHKDSLISRKILDKNNFTYRFTINVIEKVLKNRKKLDILDYGCGVGTLSFYFAHKGHFVTGIDISDKAVKIANRSAKELGLTNTTKFYALNKRKSISNKKYDLILLIEVIEHIDDDQRLIKELSNSLKNNGKIILSTPSINAPLYKLNLANSFDKRVGHIRRYTAEKLVMMMESEKLKVISIYKTEGLIRNSLYMFPLLGKFIKFIRGPVSDLVTYVDNLTIPAFGESNIYIVAKKLP